MEIPPIALGLTATGNAIQRQQARFDQQASQTVADSLGTAGPQTAGDSGQLASDLAGLKTDSVVNSILYGVFRAQADQQREAADLLKPRA
jgi:hypothetical protein